jgi:hypothetical protein
MPHHLLIGVLGTKMRSAPYELRNDGAGSRRCTSSVDILLPQPDFAAFAHEGRRRVRPQAMAFEPALCSLRDALAGQLASVSDTAVISYIAHSNSSALDKMWPP